MLKIFQFQEADRMALIRLLKANTPQFFAKEEQSDFENYLSNEIEKYLVAKMNSEVVGAGGLNFLDDGKEARLSWDMVAPAYHHQGIGRMLTEHRIKLALDRPTVERIVVRTTPMAQGFYEKMGFEVQSTAKDFWARGYDLAHMQYRDH